MPFLTNYELVPLKRDIKPQNYGIIVDGGKK